MKPLAITWVMITAMIMTVLGTWTLIEVSSHRLIAILMLASSGLLFALGIILVKNHR